MTSDAIVRPLAASDAAAARALAHAMLGATRHLARTLELLETALGGTDPECVGIVSADEHGTIESLLLHGTVAGALGVVKVHALVGASERALSAVIDATCSIAGGEARMFFCELSNAAEHASVSRALTVAGFAREASIADYYANGLTLDILVLRRQAVAPRGRV